MGDDVRMTLIIAVAGVLVLGGVQGCIVATNSQCEQTKREALKSNEPARSLVLSKSCAA